MKMKISVYMTFFILNLFCHGTLGAVDVVYTKRSFGKDYTLIFDEKIAQKWEAPDADIKFIALNKTVGRIHGEYIMKVPKFIEWLKIMSTRKPIENEIHIEAITDVFDEARNNIELRKFVSTNLVKAFPRAFNIFLKTFYHGKKALNDIKSLEEAILIRKLFNRFYNEDTAQVELDLKFQNSLNENNHNILYDWAHIRGLEKLINYWIAHISEKKDIYVKNNIECDRIADNINYLDDYLYSLRLPVKDVVLKINFYRKECKDKHPILNSLLFTSHSFQKTILREISHFTAEELKLLLAEKLLTLEEYEFELEERKRQQMFHDCPCAEFVIHQLNNDSHDIHRSSLNQTKTS